MKRLTLTPSLPALVLLTVAVMACDLLTGMVGTPGSAQQQPGPQDQALPTETTIISPTATPSQQPPQVTAQPSQTLQATLGPAPGEYQSGYGETVLVNHCFNLVEGASVTCGDMAADIRFTFAPGQGGYILPLHGLELTAGMASQPSKPTCEGGSFLGLPLEMLLPSASSTGEYYCFTTQRGLLTYYGWIRPTAFDGSGITFDWKTYQP